ncbi:hypothetical protein NOK12_03930 [Nocardioides sp. OK12]|uniref:DUF4190 domain-containing protein n=1 Tax=Nocardioides marinisabuli TaxID=419476 RepID=A0A7Y9JS35_9ACTN|nr:MULTISPECIES: DUF4190 domain-containing protein [Nocardioides]NYD58193.1 hypothetical protein [Nocardioides marinisabuli]GHJ57874.1 hypothetical protein NOK12_03930 [Nocardioides sp. OK12]
MSSTPPEGPQEPEQGPGHPGQPGQPGPSPYGEPPAQPPYAQGYPPPPTHQPYGQPFPGGGDPRQEGPPSKALAITSLVLSFLICVPFVAAIVSIVLGVIVLGRSKDGRAHGRGMAIAGIVISSLVMLATVVGIGLAVVFGLNTFKDVNDLAVGDCISAENLVGADVEEEGFGFITIEDCTDEHDAEVVGTLTLNAEQAAAYADSPVAEICQSLVLDDPDLVELVGPGIDLLTITDSAEPVAGDTVACVLYNADGSPLDEPLLVD